MDSLLDGVRVLDLTDEKGLLCGRILADIGADVIKVEKPGGDDARRIGPFFHGIPDPEKSLFWFTYNVNKRGITLDIKTSDGQQLLRSLVKTADLLIESFQPGYLLRLGLGYDNLNSINPGTIMISITPFGQTGPYSAFKSPDIVAMAMGGSTYVCGDPDRPPVRVGFAHSYLHAGAEGAAAGLLALYGREKTGRGQHVDVSMQECILWTLMTVQQTWDLTRTIVSRAGSSRKLATGVLRRNIWACYDGYVTFLLLGGLPGAKTNRGMVQWMDSRGYATDYIKNMDWESFDMSKATQEEVDCISEPVAKFFLAYKRNELYEEAIKRHIQLYPVFTIEDVVGDVQLKSRKFWVEIESPMLDSTISYPGPFAKFSETPLRRWVRAPHIGEHNREIYIDELGLSLDDLAVLYQGGII